MNPKTNIKQKSVVIWTTFFHKFQKSKSEKEPNACRYGSGLDIGHINGFFLIWLLFYFGSFLNCGQKWST